MIEIIYIMLWFSVLLGISAALTKIKVVNKFLDLIFEEE